MGKWKKRMLYTLATVLLFYGVVVAAVGLLQRRLMYFPSRFVSGVGEAIAAQEGFKPWRNAAGDGIGWRLPATGTAVGTVLVMHGNAGCALDRGYLAGPIQQTGLLEVYLLEYPGYGSRGGAPTLESILAAAEEAFGLLPKENPVYLVSESIGTGAAAYLAKMHALQVMGLALIAPYDDLASVGQRQMPYLPVSWLLRDRFTPAAWLKDYQGPVFVLVAGDDQIIPPVFAMRLYDSYAGPKRLQVIPGAGHNDIAAQSSTWWQEVLKFWQHPG